MRKSRNVSSLKMAGLFLAAGAVVLCCMGAFAQGAGGGPGQLPPEKAAKAAELEAQSVAQILSLTPEETTKLVDAHKAARESYMAAMREKLGAAGGGRPDMQAM